MNKRCIISLANERGNYQKALDRLEASVKQYNPEIDFFGYRSEDEVGAPKHLDNPYAFKVYAFYKAFYDGYTQVLWLDSSVVLRADITPVFDEIENNGYIMQEAGCFVGQWCNDFTLDYFRLTRDEANKMLMYGNAGLLGLNKNNHAAEAFYDAWWAALLAGCFKGDWETHRHDMTVGSIIANRNGMQYKKGDEWLQYSSPDAPLINETILLSAQGM